MQCNATKPQHTQLSSIFSLFHLPSVAELHHHHPALLFGPLIRLRLACILVCVFFRHPYYHVCLSLQGFEVVLRKENTVPCSITSRDFKEYRGEKESSKEEQRNRWQMYVKKETWNRSDLQTWTNPVVCSLEYPFTWMEKNILQWWKKRDQKTREINKHFENSSFASAITCF